MATTLYLVSSEFSKRTSGTFPSTSQTVSASTPSQNLSSQDTESNYGLSLTKDGNGRTTSLQTAASTAAQASLMGRWISAPLAAQTIASQNITANFSGYESSTSSNFVVRAAIAVWRPSDGTLVGRIHDLAAPSAEPGTSVQLMSLTTTGSSSVTASAGDVLVVELWRSSTTQSMGTAYYNYIHWNGYSESTASDYPSRVTFPNTLTFQAGANAGVSTFSEDWGAAPDEYTKWYFNGGTYGSVASNVLTLTGSTTLMSRTEYALDATGIIFTTAGAAADTKYFGLALSKERISGWPPICIAFRVTTGLIGLGHFALGSTWNSGGTATFDANAHRYARIRLDGTTASFETNPDHTDAGGWTYIGGFTSLDTTFGAGFNLNNVRPFVYSGTATNEAFGKINPPSGAPIENDSYWGAAA